MSRNESVKMQFYSQHGEDFIVNELFRQKEKGFFVEVGCIDGKRYSNTLFFEERGWKGICIEAHQDFIDCLKKNRPLSNVVHCAVSDIDQNEVAFYTNSRGSLSTLDPTKEVAFKQNFANYFSGFTQTTVRQFTLNSIFEHNHVTQVDLLSIDVEGCEVEVLLGLNFEKYMPAIIVVESDTKEHEKKIDSIIKNNYFKAIKIAQNIIYVSEQEILKNLNSGKYFFELVHTQHPLDSNGNLINKMMLEIRKSNKSVFYEALPEKIKTHND